MKSKIFGAVVLGFMAVGEASAQGRDRLDWQREWGRAGAAEWAITGLLAIGTLAADLHPPRSPRWEGGILFDTDVRRSLVLPTERAQRQAGTASDVIAALLLAWPLLVDGLAIAGLHDQNWDTTLELWAIDALAYATAAFVVSTTKDLLARTRPGCTDRARCRGDPYRSFMSGHSAAAFTAASLMCVHRRNLPFFDGSTADDLTCGAAITAAAAVGLLRVLADRHWLTDVVVGALVGVAAGFVLPSLVRFGFDADRNSSDLTPRPETALR